MARISQPITLPPGFDKRTTDLALEGRWIDGDKVRSVGGVIETMGGWDKFDDTNTLDGVCRGMAVWRSLDAKKHIAFGTHLRLYEYSGTTLLNITLNIPTIPRQIATAGERGGGVCSCVCSCAIARSRNSCPRRDDRYCLFLADPMHATAA